MDHIGKNQEGSNQINSRVEEALDLMNQNRTSDLEKAIEYGSSALALAEEGGTKEKISQICNSLGQLYAKIEKYDLSLKFFLRSLKINEQSENKFGVADMLNNIGLIHMNLNSNDLALQFFLDSLKLKQIIGRDDDLGYANSLNNIGAIYSKKENWENALEYFLRAKGIMELICHPGSSYGNTLCNIGLVHLKKNQTSVAKEFFMMALETYENINHKTGILNIYNNLGQLLIQNKQYEEARGFLEQGLALAEEVGDSMRKREALSHMSRLFALAHDYKHAYEHHILYTCEIERVFNMELQQQIIAIETAHKHDKSEKEAEIFKLKNVLLVQAKQKLEIEINERKKIENKLRENRNKLEQQVVERSAKLTQINLQLKQEQENLKQSYEKIARSFRGIVDTVSKIVETRDPYTSGHQLRVAKLSVELARCMKLTEDQIELIYLAALIHDIGKLSVPQEILSKPGRLNPQEFELIKTHSEVGYRILADVEFPWPLADIVLQHHERLDGSGYPGNIKGDQIMLEARLLTVADVVEAMSSQRPYRPSLGIDKALEEVSSNRGNLYDPFVVQKCVDLFESNGFEFD